MMGVYHRENSHKNFSDEVTHTKKKKKLKEMRPRCQCNIGRKMVHEKK